MTIRRLFLMRRGPSFLFLRGRRGGTAASSPSSSSTRAGVRSSPDPRSSLRSSPPRSMDGRVRPVSSPVRVVSGVSPRDGSSDPPRLSSSSRLPPPRPPMSWSSGAGNSPSEMTADLSAVSRVLSAVPGGGERGNSDPATEGRCKSLDMDSSAPRTNSTSEMELSRGRPPAPGPSSSSVSIAASNPAPSSSSNEPFSSKT
mmetsp:Transcript_36167/g.66724  ORF Transcript_36167/g.66724 Transcript_36167/m.66724 type:complete len:200 (-) Transcript_36167:58-657(-)